MKKCIDKAAIENILHKLWKKDTGYENIDIARIAYNRALQDVQKAIDSKQEEPNEIVDIYLYDKEPELIDEDDLPKEEIKDENLQELINKLYKQFPEVSFAKLTRIAVNVARWHHKGY